MAVRAYVLIESAVGSARAVYKGVHRLAVADAKVLSADTVTGPFDVIALVESPDLDRLGRAARPSLGGLGVYLLPDDNG